MATRTTVPRYAPSYPPAPDPRRRGPRILLGFLAVLILIVGGLVAAVLLLSGASLEADASALAVVKVQALGGKLVSAKAHGPGGTPIPLTRTGDTLTPKTKVAPGERITVDVVVKRPGWEAWALGDTKHEQLTVRAPVASPDHRYLTVKSGSDVRVGYDQPVSAVAFDGGATHRLRTSQDSISLGRKPAAGAVQVAVAARSWEKLGKPETVSWFPQTSTPVAVVSPGPDGKVSPVQPIRLTFSHPVDKVLGSAKPQLSPDVAGKWSTPDSHTLLFTPSGLGVGFNTKVSVHLPKAVSVTGPDGATPKSTQDISWEVPPGSFLRLHQLLAQAGYLPVSWKPAGRDVASNARAQTQAAVTPPKGKFTWRYPNTPSELKAMWKPGEATAITRGAIMKFQLAHHLTADSLAGSTVWKDLIDDAVKGKHNPFTGAAGGYSYVYVHEDASPQTMTLWHNGQTVITSPGNTGVAAAPTAKGTFPVFEHLPVTTMSGTNPDGSHYSDPGIQYVSYFNGGDALHAFNRASFGTPQSVGCVELPLASAAKVYPYTDIGTLVTVES
jgi:lipoprotein-anchoring transpeptidase ErfK/SrfK